VTPGSARAVDFRPQAPVVIRDERTVLAPPPAVWQVLTRIEAWPVWHRGIQMAVLRGELEPGTAIHWRGDGMRIVSRIAEVQPDRRVGWTLRTPGGRGYQRWILEPVSGPGLQGTRVLLEESWEGIVVSLLRRTLRKTLARSRTEWLDGLKRKTEEQDG
jgi:uncharacterized protein YndB with AHSA1/START domain